MRVVKPSEMTNCLPPNQPGVGPKFQMPLTGSRYWNTEYIPGSTHHSPAGMMKTSPAFKQTWFVLISAGAFCSCDGYKFCGSGSPIPGPEIFCVITLS